ncbi:MAG TPA: hypothetical protein VME66_04195, partial [Candidatus Acidoferrales bacterium]|nr:hypothetical protein [Candidatus Acidoferrales bacterium]
LNGSKVLIRGNHDATARKMEQYGFAEVPNPNSVIDVEGVLVWMNHYPIISPDARLLKRPPPPGDYDIAICGHVYQRCMVQSGAVNVGVDVWDFQPIGLHEVLSALIRAEDTLPQGTMGKTMNEQMRIRSTGQMSA